MFDLETAIALWLKKLQKERAFDEGVLHEMELHVRDHVEDLLGQGYEKEEAFNTAIGSFGEVRLVAEEEYTNIQSKNIVRSFLFRTMLKNYFKTTLRGMMKNPFSSVLNLFGLAISIGACMVTYAFMDHDYSIDRFHENKDDLYLTTFSVEKEGKLRRYGTTPAPLGAMLENDMASIEQVCRIHSGSAVIRYEDKVFSERLNYVDPSFLEVFTFPLKWGLSTSLQDQNSIILSQEMATKYFGDENPIGQLLKVSFGLEKFKFFKITGIAEAFPEAHLIDFDFLVHFENLAFSKPELDLHDWQQEIEATFVLIPD
ncbi:MAG: ABC transporter permease [Bacteroidota bacterium]